MRIEQVIDGNAVTGLDYFETLNPATQEVLAEVHAAFAAAKAAFPEWAGLPAPQRAKLIRRLGELALEAGIPEGIGHHARAGTWSYDVVLEPKNIAVSLGLHHIPHWGAS